MQYEIQGKLIVCEDTQVISDKFQKRLFVIEKKETSPNGFEFVDTIPFQLTQKQVGLLDQFSVGQEVIVHFNIRGNKWEKDGKTSYFVNLNAWKIEATVSNNTQPQYPTISNNTKAPEPDEDGNLPF